MKKYLLLLMLVLTGSFLGTAQEYKIKRKYRLAQVESGCSNSCRI